VRIHAALTDQAQIREALQQRRPDFGPLTNQHQRFKAGEPLGQHIGVLHVVGEDGHLMAGQLLEHRSVRSVSNQSSRIATFTAMPLTKRRGTRDPLVGFGRLKRRGQRSESPVGKGRGSARYEPERHRRCAGRLHRTAGHDSLDSILMDRDR